MKFCDLTAGNGASFRTQHTQGTDRHESLNSNSDRYVLTYSSRRNLDKFEISEAATSVFQRFAEGYLPHQFFRDFLFAATPLFERFTLG